jgi:hypothetical protein
MPSELLRHRQCPPNHRLHDLRLRDRLQLGPADEKLRPPLRPDKEHGQQPSIERQQLQMRHKLLLGEPVKLHEGLRHALPHKLHGHQQRLLPRPSELHGLLLQCRVHVECQHQEVRQVTYLMD